MLASSLIMLAASVMSVVAQTTTATSYLTATVTITKCSPDNTACPLYTPPPSSTSSSSSISTPPVYPTSSVALNTTTSSSSVFYPVSNSTTHVGPTAYPNTTSSYVIPTTYATFSSVVPTTPVPAVPSTSAPAVPPTSGAGLVSVQSGLLMGVVAMGAALLA
ncbi:hypothetical protein GGS26DRAFT_157643 [Hypomontagnella submonticulosa]|nr:hypothetical protein GGS26DRAFT_157643 [Hypomontagnella submonticulosa]